MAKRLSIIIDNFRASIEAKTVARKFSVSKSIQSNESSDDSVQKYLNTTAKNAIGVVADEQNKPEKLVCYFDESPYYILKVAAQGNLDEVRRLVEEDANRCRVRDYRDQNVVHHAVTWSRLAVLDWLYQPYIASGLADINARDKLGNTPLHHAVDRLQIKAFTWLLMHGANVKLLNNQRMGAIHLAIEMKSYEFVSVILKHSPNTVHLRGDLGYTPLHYACAMDLPDIAGLLLNYGAKLLENCDVGYPPIHSATRNGSSNVIDVLLQHASKLGMSEKALIHVADKEKNLPLHLAANSGDIRAVKVCLKAGADIDRLNESDRQTAIHYASAQGALDMIKEMFQAQPHKLEICIHLRDIQEQTPLHKAAMFNHDEVVKFLIESGASINAQDAERRTPLLLAASKNAVNAVRLLLRHRANVSLRDKENRNFLHIAIIHNFNLIEVSEFTSLKTLNQLLNERDDFGRCPVHYASCRGQLATLQHLIQLGAVVTLKDNDKQSPLHHSAARGRYQTCKKLLASEHGALLMNEVDGEGQTAVHVAAKHGHYKVIALLVRKGALMNKDFHQNTPLHLAAERGNHEAVILLVGLAPHHLNAKNSAKNTPLHLAAQNGHAVIVDYLMSMDASFELNEDGASFLDLAIAKFQSDVAAAIIRHRRSEEAMQLPSTFGYPVIGLIQHLPKVCLQLLDRCVTYSAENKKSLDFYVHYDFQYLQQQYDLSPGFKRRLGPSFKPLLPLETMVRYNRVELLSHPLSVRFLRQKWSLYGNRIYSIEVMIYLLFLGLLTAACLRIDEQISRVFGIQHLQNSTNITTSKFPSDLDHRLDTSDFRTEIVLVVSFCAINFCLQIIRAYQQGLAFLFDFANYSELALYLSTGIGFIPYLIDHNHPSYVTFSAAATALFLGWFNLLLYMRRFDWFGIYIVMFVEVGKTLIRTLTVFSFIIIACALEFYIVFKTTHGPMSEFKSIPVAIMTTFSMMASEAQYSHIIVPTLDGRYELILGNAAYVVFVAFLILLPTLLMNLLVGLAVGDIQATQKSAGLKRLAMQVKFFADLEHRLPEALIIRTHMTEYKHFPNRFRFKVFEMYRQMTSGSTSLDACDELNSDICTDVDRDKKSELGFVIEELIAHSRQMRTMMAKIESTQNTLGMIWQRMIENDDGITDGPLLEFEDSECDDASTPRSPSLAHGLEFFSPGSQANWQAFTTRFTEHRKATRTHHLWRLNDSPQNRSQNRSLPEENRPRTSSDNATTIRQ